MKIIVTIIPTALVTKTRISSSANWWSSNEKYLFFFLFSRVLLQGHAEFNRLL